MTRKEISDAGLIPFTTMFKDVMNARHYTIYNDKRKGKISKRRIKVCHSTFKPSYYDIEELKKRIIDYGYELLSHGTYNKERRHYVFYFKNIDAHRRVKLKVKEFYHKR